MACPACGVPDGCQPAAELRGSFSLLAFLAGGLFAVLFHNASRPRKMQCNKCGSFFSIRTPFSKVSRAIFWLLVAPTVIGIIILLLRLLNILFTR